MKSISETPKNPPVNDYDRIAEVIRFLDTNHADPPDIASISAHVGLNPSHFQRMISEWAGTTPKDFLQSLSLSRTRKRLAASQESRQPGPARLHDPVVTLEAATPDEIKARGAGMTILTGVAQSPFGNCLIGDCTRGICHLSFFDGGGRDNAIGELWADWPLATLVSDDAHAAQLAREIFTPANPPAAWKLFVRGTAFQLRVWRALLNVPAGTLVSYGKLAAATGNPNASRATGTAVGRNAISFLIPCHRVIRETGISGHYRWGAVRKRAILAWEISRGHSHTQ